ncbi:hypothetical protein ACFSAG_10945 [Sphingorhabdus buctiana]|uniref:Uncharacterized protein n=1 Tax=Sphingorhabdus buctiana TaxID=1508805 RepID=A0ABW4MFU4_9SPHN
MAHPFAAFAVAGGQGLVKEHLPQLCAVQPFVDHLQKAVKAHRHRDYLWLGKRRIDAVEQCEGELCILPRIGGDAILTHPACFLPLDRGGHQPVGYHPPRDDQRRLPPQAEGIAARGAAQRIAATDTHPHRSRRILDKAIVGQMRKERRLPPRAPPIGAAFITQIGGGRQADIGVLGLFHDAGLSFEKAQGISRRSACRTAQNDARSSAIFVSRKDAKAQSEHATPRVTFIRISSRLRAFA